MLVERQRAELHAADAQQVVDEAGQPRGFGIDRVEKLLLLLDVDHVGQRQRFGVGLDVGQRRAQLVRGRVDELVAHLLGQLLLRDVAHRPHVGFLLAAADDANRVAGDAGHAALAVLLARQLGDDRPVAVFVRQQRIGLRQMPALDQLSIMQRRVSAVVRSVAAADDVLQPQHHGHRQIGVRQPACRRRSWPRRPGCC